MPIDRAVADLVPTTSVKIMQLYARMTPEKRRMLLHAAQIIATASQVWDDPITLGGLETHLADFDSKN